MPPPPGEARERERPVIERSIENLEVASSGLHCAWCLTCGWESGDRSFKAAHQAAHVHRTRFGHRVVVGEK